MRTGIEISKPLNSNLPHVGKEDDVYFTHVCVYANGFVVTVADFKF